MQFSAFKELSAPVGYSVGKYARLSDG